ncbi:MAG: hypothetical protein H0V31_02720 [Acidobacteria bacterium]|jgi:hypothetical protein|nr:hypothetical protein [Acidobacteriota bacterium]
MKRKKSDSRRFLNCLSIFVLLFILFSANTQAQQVVDKTVATVGDGVGVPELITYSDLLWQLALDSDVPINPPTSDDLNRALQLLINQRLFALEAERVPRGAPTEKQIKAEIERILAQFPSTAEFEKRLRLVGFDSINDDNFQQIMARRVAIENYLDFRFRSFVVITPEDEAKYYREVYTPEFRRKNPGLLLPPLDQKRLQINRTLTEEKVASDIEEFLDDAKRRAEIIVLSEV